MPWVYILRCADDSYYVGSARDLEGRINQHAIGKAEAYTKRRRPLTLVWAQECENIGEAFELERQIKGWRRDKRLALIEGRYADLPGLSKAGPTSRSFDRLRTRFASVTRPELVEGQDGGPSTGSGHEYDRLRTRYGQRALKYFASGWWTIMASVDCSGCSCSSSDSSTPIRSGRSRSTSFTRSSRSGQAG